MPSKTLNVIVLTSSYPRYPGDNASVFLRYLNASLSKKGIEIHLVAPASDVAEKQLDDGVHVYRFRYLPRPLRKLAYGSGILPNLRNNPLLWITVPFFLLSMAASLVRNVYRTKADIIHCHWVIPQGLIAMLTAPFHRKKYIITVHGGDAYSLNSHILQFVKRCVLRHAKAWTANTDSTAAAAVRPEITHNARIIPMGVDVKIFSEGKRNTKRKGMPIGTHVILFVGRLVEQKGVSILLKAFSIFLESSEQNTVLWIVGDGIFRKKLEMETGQLNIGDKVRFWGNINNELLPDFYAAADIFVGPSIVDDTGNSEGQGVVFIEAFASGTPVIASRVGGISDIIEHGRSGYLVPPASPELLAIALAELSSNPVLRNTLILNAKKDVFSKYNWQRIADDFYQLYQEVLEK